MGFFSWLTQDSGRSICNKYSGRKPFPVVMVLKDGTTFVELDYNGYGVFGGKDFFVAMGDMNGLRKDGDSDEDVRMKAIDLYYGAGGEVPNLFEYQEEKKYEWIEGKPEDCPVQGYFYE